uniref:RNase H type-1 domain-containing protein n=1 Tax=viral metagenome TaxID=1070528 RepID=A0A6C0AZN8_9ZZZZ
MFSPAMMLPFAQRAIRKTAESASKYKIDGKYILYFDGCSKGNPGPGGAGAVLYENDVEIWADSIFVGKKVTNNIAEYSGLILGLEFVAKQKILNIEHLLVRGDSQLVIKQMRGEYKVSSPHLLELHTVALQLGDKIQNVHYEHVKRELNKRADTLSNDGLLKDIV